ncbi:MAG: acyltransferase [Erysipelotrichaceae bacterium]|nr:acyltransferase [Erysipelotrichaceae bacterium]
MKNQIIQILRAFAIAAVVVIHTYPFNEIGIIIRPFVNYAVALFIFCSGYLTKLKYPDLLKFYRKRILRIGIPYLIWTLIYMIRDFSTYGSFLIFLKNYVYIALHGTAIVPMYFVIVYIGLVLSTPLIGRLAESRWRHAGWLFSPVYIILKTYIPKLAGITVIPSQLYFLQFFGWFTFYYLGILLGNHIIQYRKTKRFTIYLYLFTIILSMAEGFIWNSVGDYDMATSQGKLSCLLSSSIACLAADQYLQDTAVLNKNRLNSILITIGDYSFGIYLSHILILRILNNLPIWQSVVFPVNSCSVLLFTLLFLIAADKVFCGKLNRLLGIQ